MQQGVLMDRREMERYSESPTLSNFIQGPLCLCNRRGEIRDLSLQILFELCIALNSFTLVPSKQRPWKNMPPEAPVLVAIHRRVSWTPLVIRLSPHCSPTPNPKAQLHAWQVNLGPLKEVSHLQVGRAPRLSE